MLFSKKKLIEYVELSKIKGNIDNQLQISMGCLFVFCFKSMMMMMIMKMTKIFFFKFKQFNDIKCLRNFILILRFRNWSIKWCIDYIMAQFWLFSTLFWKKTKLIFTWKKIEKEYLIVKITRSLKWRCNSFFSFTWCNFL